MMKKFFGLSLLSILFVLVNFALPLFADQEASNAPLVKSSEYGRLYAKSIPDDFYGAKGKTLVYGVGKKEDKLLYTFDWYSNQLYLLGGIGSVVRLGPWARGREPNKDHLAIGFYLKGGTLKEYSTLDIVKLGCSISNSVSHYTVFEEIIGYRWVRNDIWVFDIKTHDGKVLSFDVATGKIRTQQEEKHDEIIKKIQSLKGSWFSSNRDMLKEDAYNYSLTPEELKGWAKERFPEVPQGYKLHIGSFFSEVRLEKKK